MSYEARMLGGEDILTDKDLKDLNASVRRVFELMRDGKLHSAKEIRLAAGINGVPASEGLRRMRQLRDYFDIDRVRDTKNSRMFWYRLLPKGSVSHKRVTLDQVRKALRRYVVGDKCDESFSCRVLKKPCRYCEAMEVLEG